MNVTKRLFAVSGLILFLLVISVSAWKYHKLTSQIFNLQNQIAKDDVTHEVQKNEYERLTIVNRNINDLMQNKDHQIVALAQELKKKNEQIVSFATAELKWKHAYEASVNGKQTEEKGPTGEIRQRVDFSKDFGYIGAEGYTLTNPPMAHLKIMQNRPLRLSIAMTQKKDGSWSTRVLSSEDNVGIDIQSAYFNPYVLEHRWYEKIGVNFALGGGTTGQGVGAIGGVGLLYDVGQFQLGPNFWTVATDRVDKFYGMSLVWRPFTRAK